MMDKHFNKFSKFLIGVGANSLFNFLLFNLLFLIFEYSYITYAYIISCFIATITAYLINRKFVFRNKTRVSNFKNFFILEMVLVCLTVLIFKIVNEIYFFSVLFSIIILYSIRLIITYIVYFHFIFKE